MGFGSPIIRMLTVALALSTVGCGGATDSESADHTSSSTAVDATVHRNFTYLAKQEQFWPHVDEMNAVLRRNKFPGTMEVDYSFPGVLDSDLVYSSALPYCAGFSYSEIVSLGTSSLANVSRQYLQKVRFGYVMASFRLVTDVSPASFDAHVNNLADIFYQRQEGQCLERTKGISKSTDSFLARPAPRGSDGNPLETTTRLVTGAAVGGKVPEYHLIQFANDESKEVGWDRRLVTMTSVVFKRLENAVMVVRSHFDFGCCDFDRDFAEDVVAVSKVTRELRELWDAKLGGISP